MATGTRPIVAVFGVREIDDLPSLSAARELAALHFATTEAELAAVLPDTEVVLIWEFRSRALEQLWSRAGNLKWVHWGSAGVDAALFPALRDSDVILTNARGVFDHAMAEYALGLVLCFAKGFPRTVRSQDRRQWDFRYAETIRDRTALVVGTGSIGSAIGAMLRAAGMRVAGVARSARTGDPVFGEVWTFADLDEHLAGADYVINVTPSTPGTRGLFTRERFERMKPEARFINMGRGDAVDEEALVAALEHARIAGAALDVLHTEPLPESSPLWAMDNVIVSPHMSGDVHGSEDVLIGQFVDNLRRFISGEPLENVVDKQKGY